MGKCVYCHDPIRKTQRLEVKGKKLPFHRGCLFIALKAEGANP